MPRKSPRAHAAALRSDPISRMTLTHEVQRQIKTFGLNQAMAAKFLDDAATQINRLMNGHAEEFSADRLVRFIRWPTSRSHSAPRQRNSTTSSSACRAR